LRVAFPSVSLTFAESMSAYLKYLPLNDELYEFMRRQRSGAGDPVLAALREETASLGDDSRMQISEEQGDFLGVLASLMGVRNALEVGTFTGYSALCVARALPEGGKLLCLDFDDDWTAIAKKHWKRAGVNDRIELRIGPAIETLHQLEPDRLFDFVFIDADKTEYDAYYELILPLVRPNGVILFDNMFWGGFVLEGSIDHPSAHALRELNAKLASDERIECVLLPIADGIQMCRKR
jgi:caffeoyl-CoA O-methyltransferase